MKSTLASPMRPPRNDRHRFGEVNDELIDLCLCLIPLTSERAMASFSRDSDGDSDSEYEYCSDEFHFCTKCINDQRLNAISNSLRTFTTLTTPLFQLICRIPNPDFISRIIAVCLGTFVQK